MGRLASALGVAAACGLAVAAASLPGAAAEFELEIPHGSEPKCITEDLVDGTLVLASYKVVEDAERHAARLLAEKERENAGAKRRSHRTNKVLSEALKKAGRRSIRKRVNNGDIDPTEDYEDLDDEDDEDEDEEVEPAVHVKVVSPTGAVLHDEDDAEEGELSFIAESTGNYVFCFTNAFEDDDEGAGPIGLMLDIRTGIHARHWHAVAKKEDLAGFERELRKVEVEISEVHKSLLAMKEREQVMRDKSELTNSRVAWMSTASILVVAIAGVVQTLSLRAFFKKKKVL